MKVSRVTNLGEGVVGTKSTEVLQPRASGILFRIALVVGFKAVLRIRIRIRTDPHCFGLLDPD
jgi:hypothetical protein